MTLIILILVSYKYYTKTLNVRRISDGRSSVYTHIPRLQTTCEVDTYTLHHVHDIFITVWKFTKISGWVGGCVRV